MLGTKSANPLCCPSQRRVLVFAWLAAGCLCGGAEAQPPTAIPDYPGQVMLIKNTVTAVNHGNITGNYTVLRDLACEQFRRRNTAGDLAQTFAGLRQRNLDLSPILVTEPQLNQPPERDRYGRLQLVGYFPTRPKAVRFMLIFRPVDGGWMIDEVSLGVAPTESVVQQPALQPASQDRHSASAPTVRRLPGYTAYSP